MTRSLKTYVGRHQNPVVNHTDRVNWDESKFTQAGAQPTSSRIILRDPDGEYWPQADDDDFVLGYHNVVRVVENASGSDVNLFRGRIEVLDTGRGPLPQKVDRYREHEITISDYNRDLFGIDVHNFETTEGQTDVQAVQYLISRYLSGSPRASTNLNGSNYVSSSNTRNIDANTYDGMTPFEVLEDIAAQTDKEFFVDVDGNLHYDGANSTAFVSSINISDRLNDQSSNTFQPNWVAGAAKHADGTEMVTSIRSYFGPDENTHSITVTNTQDDKFDFWQVPYFDDKAPDVTVAERRATAELNYAGRPYVTDTCQIGPIPREWAGYIKGGQRIQVKARAIPGSENFYTPMKIAELAWEYVKGDPTQLLATLVLERPRVRHRGPGGGAAQPTSTTPTPPPECEPADPSGLPDDDLSADWRGGGDPQRVDPATGSGPAPPWGSLGDQPAGSTGSTHTRVAAREQSQYFSVTASGTVQVSTTLAKIGGPVTAAAEIKFYNAGLVNIGVAGELYPSGSAPSYPSSPASWSIQSFTFNVPATAVWGRFSVDTKSAVQYVIAGAPAGPAEECPPHSVDPNGNPNDPSDNGGDSPYYAPSNDPRFSATDQHIITRLSREMTNVSGGDLMAGAVVIATGTDEFTTTTTASYAAGMVGVLKEAIADDATGTVIWAGVGTAEVPIFTGSVTTGDFIFTSTTPGSATSSATRSAGAVGKVIEASGGDALFVEWWGIPDGAGGSGAVATDTIWDAKGDLAAGTGSNTAAKLTVGADDTILMADAAQSTGLKWVARGTPSTQAFGDSAVVGTVDAFAGSDHKHAMPADPVTAHAAASDPHTGYVLESLLDAKGDLIVATANDTPSRLAAGANGLVLTTDSSVGAGVKWAAGPAVGAEDWEDVMTALSSGMVHRWKFEESTGTNINDEISTLDLTLTGSVSLAAASPLGNAVSFTGGYAESSGLGSIPVGDAARSVLAIWKKTAVSAPATMPIFAYGAGSTRQLFQHYSPSQSGSMNATTFGDDLSVGFPAADGEWHMSVMMNGTIRMLSLNMDGRTDTKWLGAVLNTSAANNFHVAAEYDDSDACPITVTDVIVWDRMLRKSELERLWEALRPLI